MMIAFLLLPASEIPIADACRSFAARYERPVTISASPISAARLEGRRLAAPERAGERPRSALGLLTYRGFGIAMRSSDPRMAEVVQPGIQELGGRCSYQFWGPTGWNAFDEVRQPWTLYFRRLREPLDLGTGSTAAAKRGSAPILAGYRTLSSWPIRSACTSYFLGLMAPLSKAPHTAIVAFSAAPARTPAILLARLPMRFDTLSVTPGLHEPYLYLNLEGLAHGPEFRRVVLELSDDQAREVGKQLHHGQ